ncbi:50S ribosomal protein L18 [Candidatus Pacearchaeota archaeon]|nr:50S ribosomal protein L18 [Candidatus Pacearchaeota archaeon]|tara:strand:+ start:6793 stop:7296 length:504 start_codon:yes stop_codon:yes gene_type:complete
MTRRTQKRRRKENKTDYKLRMNLLKSGKPRIVIRKTNKYFIAQAVESHEAQDKVLAGVSSRDLIKKGWDGKFKGSLKGVPAGYLTGLLMAKKLSDSKDEFILDLGMARTIYGNRIYAVVTGLVDGGVNVKVDKKVFPSKERLDGEHLKPEVKEMISKVKSKLGVQNG